MFPPLPRTAHRIPPTQVVGAARRAPIALALLFAFGCTLAAAAAPATLEEVFTLRHVRAATALELVVPLLSATGSVELRQASNALAVRDTAEAIAQIRSRLDALDRPVVPLIVELQIFEGMAEAGSGPALALDRELAARLKELFRFADYRLVTAGRVLTREGENVLYQAAGGFQVRFQAGRVEADGQLRLEAFALEREEEAGGWTPLVSGRLQLVAGRPLVLALTRSEDAERALFLAITCRTTPTQDSRPKTQDRAGGRGDQ